MNKKLSFLALVASGFLLSSCDSLRHTFGLDHYSGDAFNITQNAALSVPPEYSLVPPTPGAANKGNNNAPLKAQQALFGKEVSYKNVVSSTKSSSSEASFLNSASSNKAIQPNIRETLNKEAEEENTLTHKLKKLQKQASRNLGKEQKNDKVENDIAAEPPIITAK